MAKSKAKRTPFSLKNFLIMFIAIGTIVGLAFWVGRVTRPEAQAHWWYDIVAWRAGYGKFYGNTTSAGYCRYGSYYVQANYIAKNGIKVIKYGKTQVSQTRYSSDYYQLWYSVGDLVKWYCTELKNGKY